ncbi:RNA polymerase subunit, putative [Plasmodium ovale curtisi]|uniref:RNA polymerase subunit, putative n=1 Tax=Plasmodium ovale curtisi TaxID=864141 RepID=A0A1A8WEK7_PLAOA|nr:RNA polymerase subunit, putative [Plasmodium ovale curtisi]
MILQLEDIINIEAHFKDDEIKGVIEFLLRAKYIDKVLHNVGFCVGLYDILEVKNKEILKGTGEIRFKVIFRLVFFQPFENEIVEGFVKSSDSNGIIISLGFFENIRVNCANLKEPKEFDSEKREWYWTYEGIKFFYTKNELIRVRILDTYFSDPNEANKEEAIPSMSITGTVQQDGLGLFIFVSILVNILQFLKYRQVVDKMVENNRVIDTKWGKETICSMVNLGEKYNLPFLT